MNILNVLYLLMVISTGIVSTVWLIEYFKKYENVYKADDMLVSMFVGFVAGVLWPITVTCLFLYNVCVLITKRLNKKKD